MFRKKTLVLIFILISIIILIISVYNILMTKKIGYYRKQEKLMRIAAITYFENYPIYLPKDDNESNQVVLSSLINEKYIEKVIDIEGSDCSEEKSYVRVLKNSKDTYTYFSYLVCPNYQTKK